MNGIYEKEGSMSRKRTEKVGFIDTSSKVIYDIYKISTYWRLPMTTQMIIRIDSEMKNRLSKLARVEGKTTSQMVRELIEDYVKEKDIGAYIDSLWDRVGGKLRSKGINEKDIHKAIRASRKSR